MTEARALRLADRFATIRESVAAVRGKDMAFGASCVAKLEAIEYMCLQALRRIEMQGMHRDPSTSLVSEMHKEIKAVLQSFHKDICEHLALDQLEVFEASSAFKEIVDDICNQRG